MASVYQYCCVGDVWFVHLVVCQYCDSDVWFVHLVTYGKCVLILGANIIIFVSATYGLFTYCVSCIGTLSFIIVLLVNC